MAAGGEKSIAGGSSATDLKRKGAHHHFKAHLMFLQNYLLLIFRSFHAGSEASSGPNVKKAKGMFMMAGLEDEDFTDSSDEEEEEGEGKTKAVTAVN